MYVSLAFYKGDIFIHFQSEMWFPMGLLIAQSVKNMPAMQESTCNAGDPGLIPGSGRFPWRRKCNPLQYSCLENPTVRGAWWAI